uniref:b(0,+)-type amino acid transporter 1 n=1 Tax=Culicoides sonorensis TaxID=179676 RepID=A0A336LV27_CULSO
METTKIVPVNVNSDEKSPKPSEKVVGLKRHLGLLAAVNVILSVMIGSGIFISPTPAFKYSGSIGLCLIIWTGCGLISFLGALCFAELGTLVSRSGADYVYILEGMRELDKFWGPLPAFIYAWVVVLFLRPVAVAVVILTFGEYCVNPFTEVFELCDAQKQFVIQIVGLIALGIITCINYYSVKLYVKINNVFGVCKIIACLFVIAGGAYELIIGNTKNLSHPFKGTNASPHAIALAFYNGLWSYDGWSMVTQVTEEVKNPEKNIPRSIAIAVPIVTFLYVFMNLAYFTALSPDEITKSIAVGIDFGDAVLGSFSFIIPLGVALSTFSCAMSMQFGVTRICYVAGTEGHMSACLSYVNTKRQTPAPSVVLQGIITAFFIFSGDVISLIEVASFLIWLFYGLAFTALLIMRRTRPDAKRPYRVPTIIPICLIIVAAFLVFMPIVNELSLKYLGPVAFILLGVVVYVPFVYQKKRPRFMDRLTRSIQIMFEVVPPETKIE